ncbi:nuclear transport factor 2 family protein [Hwanghaeella sp.]|uniref:nuclear transport factor 2 family protein n=1 Tax=Hwanghaeella sp. TaxID=2605943 RepID=UPI003CCBE5BB
MMTEETALFANDAFYAAFREGDYPAMSALWATDAKQCCIHPMWEPLFGREAVLASWKEVLRTPPPVECVTPYVVSSHAMATVFCFEKIEQGVLAATNVYILEQGRPRMVHHQAASTRGRPKAGPGESRVIN